MSWLLQTLGKRICEGEQLDRYFSELREAEAEYDPSTERFRCQSLEAKWQTSYSDYCDWSIMGLPLPSVPLLRVLRAIFMGPLTVEQVPLAMKDCSRQRVASVCNVREASKKGAPPVKGTMTVDAQIDVYTEVCLALGPRTGPGDLGILFETHTIPQLNVGGKSRELTFDRAAFPIYAREGYSNFVGSVAARLDDGWHRISGFGSTGWKVKAGGFYNGGYGIDVDYSSPLGPVDRDPEYFGNEIDAGLRFPEIFGTGDCEWATYCVAVDRLSVAACMSFLEKTAEAKKGRRLSTQWPLLGEAPSSRVLTDEVEWEIDIVGSDRGPEIYLFQDDTSREFEQALHTGVIERALVKACRDMKERWQRTANERQEGIRRQNERLLERWDKLALKDDTKE